MPASTERTTPGPETPVLTATSAFPMPWKAPAMNGLSSTALQKTTSLAQPMQLRSLVSSAARTTVLPISRTASLLMPALVEPMFTDEQTRSVEASASGIALISSRSPALNPLWTKAENPPMKSTPTVFATSSSASAYFTGSPPETPQSIDSGVTEILLLTIGMPYLLSSAQPVETRSSA